MFDRLRPLTKQGFELITEIGGEQDPPCEWYCQIVREGTEHDFNETTNNEWLTQTRPILEAFWHTKYFLTMMAKYAKQLDGAPQCLPSGALPVRAAVRQPAPHVFIGPAPGARLAPGGLMPRPLPLYSGAPERSWARSDKSLLQA